MSKKYLSLDEAAARLGLTNDQLMRIREQGEIHGFHDRGSWMFRESDVEEFLRLQQADSSPDFPIFSPDDAESVLADSAPSVPIVTPEEPDQTDDDPSVLADSDPMFPIMEPASASALDDDDPSVDDLSSDSDVRLSFDESMFDDEDEAGALQDVGSDVRLTGDSGPKLETDSGEEKPNVSGWDSDAKLSDSDSDVRLVEPGAAAPEDDDDLPPGLFDDVLHDEVDSDSDVKLATDRTDDDLPIPAELSLSDSDSDVRLSEEPDEAEEDDSGISFFDEIDSDSDVKLAGIDGLLDDEDSDSDVKLSAGLERTDSDIRLMEPSATGSSVDADEDVLAFPDDSDLKLIDSGSQVRQPDSGITLPAADSSSALNLDESGISLEIDSGISLDADDSGISLESFDSSPALSDDSGISMDAADSGIGLAFDDESGISLDMDDDEDDMSRTMPMKAVPGAGKLMSESGAMTTEFDVDGSGMDDSEFELARLDDDEEAGTSTSVLNFDEGDDDDDSSRTVAVGAVRGSAVADDVDDEEYADEEGYDDEFADDEGYADDFDEEGEEGSGAAGFTAPAGGRPYRMEADWGTGTKVMIGMGTLLSLLSALIGVELVRTMWLWTQPGSPKSGILEMIGGLFG